VGDAVRGGGGWEDGAGAGDDAARCSADNISAVLDSGTKGEVKTTFFEGIMME
jgi:hypothetical protein